MPPPKSTDTDATRSTYATMRDARDELRECAELLKALDAVDLSRDLTKPAWRRAREALATASHAYAAAHDAHAGGTPEERRRAAREVHS